MNSPLARCALAALLLPAASCELLDASQQCPQFESEYQTLFAQSGELAQAIPDGPDGYAMAVVLNTKALNDLFRKLGSTDVPELARSTSVLGQTLRVGVTPSIPLLQIGGTRSCPSCLAANVPVSLNLSLGGTRLPAASGAIRVQMPVGLVADGTSSTQLLAQFQAVEVLDLELDVDSGVAATVLDVIEPIAQTLLTDWLRSRYSNVEIASFATWEVGQGVRLAGRGPFIDNQRETLTIAMQSNLRYTQEDAFNADPAIPPGADIGVLFHPKIIESLTKRLLFEGEIPQAYTDGGAPDPNGTTRLTLSSMTSDPGSGLLRTQMGLWRTGSLCGAADVAASMAMTADTTNGLRFTIRDFAITGGRGAGAFFQQADWVSGGMVSSLLSTLELTVGYDEILGGEQLAEASTGVAGASIDARGISVYFNLLD